jgi:hypothetical protein
VLKYLEEYDIALEGFRTALAIDPTLPALVSRRCGFALTPAVGCVAGTLIVGASLPHAQ